MIWFFVDLKMKKIKPTTNSYFPLSKLKHKRKEKKRLDGWMDGMRDCDQIHRAGCVSVLKCFPMVRSYIIRTFKVHPIDY